MTSQGPERKQAHSRPAHTAAGCRISQPLSPAPWQHRAVAWAKDGGQEPIQIQELALFSTQPLSGSIRVHRPSRGRASTGAQRQMERQGRQTDPIPSKSCRSRSLGGIRRFPNSPLSARDRALLK